MINQITETIFLETLTLLENHATSSPFVVLGHGQGCCSVKPVISQEQYYIQTSTSLIDTSQTQAYIKLSRKGGL